MPPIEMPRFVRMLVAVVYELFWPRGRTAGAMASNMIWCASDVSLTRVIRELLARRDVSCDRIPMLEYLELSVSSTRFLQRVWRLWLTLRGFRPHHEPLDLVFVVQARCRPQIYWGTITIHADSGMLFEACDQTHASIARTYLPKDEWGKIIACVDPISGTTMVYRYESEHGPHRWQPHGVVCVALMRTAWGVEELFVIDDETGDAQMPLTTYLVELSQKEP